MAIIDKIADTVTSLLPRRKERTEVPPVGAEVMALRDDLDRWLQRFFDEPWGLPGAGDGRWMPAADVQETDNELIVSVEVPGLDREHLDISLTPEALVIRGEKQEASEDRGRNGYMLERRYGSFVRTVPLPPGIDLDRADARVKRGVLTVRFPRVAGAGGSRRIPVRTS
jgi:HSP20 family protein